MFRGIRSVLPYLSGLIKLAFETTSDIPETYYGTYITLIDKLSLFSVFSLNEVKDAWMPPSVRFYLTDKRPAMFRL